MPDALPLLLRDSRDADLPAITAIYRHHVLHGTASFELDPPDQDEMTRRRGDVLAKCWPWIVAEDRETGVLGYAYANHFRPRPAYRFTVENSIYVADGSRGRGLGRLLLAELIARCETAGARQMLAVIGDSANQPSIALHRALGFGPAGVLRSVGHKHGQWRDVVLMQRELGAADRATP
jgi:phosphinothricin acetyltransferase